MIRDVTIDDAIQFFNDLLDLDQPLVQKLIENRLVCNEQLANHPTVQVSSDSEGHYLVGVLGIINGLFGVYDDGLRVGWGGIAAVYDSGKLIRFMKLENTE